MFAAMFAAYVVLHNNTFGAATVKDVASLPYVFVLTAILLASSFTVGLASIAFDRGRRIGVNFWLLVTFALGLTFVLMQHQVFQHLLATGNSWHRSAFLSIYFTLIGGHWFHVIIALLWILVLLIQFPKLGFTYVMRTRLTCLSMFVHFITIMWVFIFAIVYLMGAI